MSAAAFASDRKTNRAVSFEFVVIGEAVARLPEAFTSRYPDLPWQEMNAVRNYAVHEYFRLSLDVLWAIVTDDLPTLRQALMRIRDQV